VNIGFVIDDCPESTYDFLLSGLSYKTHFSLLWICGNWI